MEILIDCLPGKFDRFIIISVFCQESGSDGPVTTLRDVIQKQESAGMIDMALGGHDYSRPAGVVQGRDADRSAA